MFQLAYEKHGGEQSVKDLDAHVVRSSSRAMSSTHELYAQLSCDTIQTAKPHPKVVRWPPFPRSDGDVKARAPHSTPTSRGSPTSATPAPPTSLPPTLGTATPQARPGAWRFGDLRGSETMTPYAQLPHGLPPRGGVRRMRHPLRQTRRHRRRPVDARRSHHLLRRGTLRACGGQMYTLMRVVRTRCAATWPLCRRPSTLSATSASAADSRASWGGRCRSRRRRRRRRPRGPATRAA